MPLVALRSVRTGFKSEQHTNLRNFTYISTPHRMAESGSSMYEAVTWIPARLVSRVNAWSKSIQIRLANRTAISRQR
jgi:hypothetical protein